ncbi:LAME_0G17436g1_1 [Lachancea meyersii CBS 8951]|uniref:DNA damage-inducible protein 1 n=1 Tax=Lachancea meyersii CBS 8951 TaxID=1266667 RepID=A0A1G4KBE7_9SACH|nr:LAME_0G17436g1_1 [Lachancea meyersii CBS 8951]
MRITINNEVTDDFLTLDVSADMELKDLTALLQLDCGFDSEIHEIWFANRVLDPKGSNSLEQTGLVNDELVAIKTKKRASGLVSGGENSAQYAMIEHFRQQVAQNPVVRSQLASTNPEFASIVDDPVAFRERAGPNILQSLNPQGSPQNPFGIPQQEYNQLMQNPDYPANQERINELISQQEIDEQMRNALEFTPEVFTPVHMLYINLEINGTPVKAFVDSGAQTTIISTRLAQKTGLFRLIDKRFHGEAHGVGVQKILGKIHVAQVKIETQFIPCSFTVIDTHVDMLLGLDMLKRHQSCIDLKDNVLRIAGAETRFLSEAELPKDFDAKTLSATAAGETSVQTPVQGSGSAAAPPKVNSAPAAAAAPQRQYPESSVKQLMDLGFSRAEVLQALHQANGNAEIAAALLFQ